MPQVPYSPVPGAVPSGEATPSLRVSPSIEAFGGSVAQATQGLGRAIEGAGNELFGRAIAMQDLANRTEADEATTKYMIAAGELHAKYNSLQGKDAVDGLKPYYAALESTRQDVGKGVSNPAAARLFNSESRSTMARSMFNGAGHAATQNKQWAIGTAKATMEVDAKSVEDSPQDEVLFQEKLNRVHANAQTLSELQGFEEGGPQAQALYLKESSKLWAQRITGLARTKPFEAVSMLEKNKTQLTGEDYLRVDQTVRAQGRAVGSANIADSVYDPTKPLKEMEDAGRAKAQKLAPDDPLLEKATVAAIQGKYNQDKYATRQQELQDTQAFKEAVANGPDGKGVKTAQELLTIPGMDAVIARLPPSTRNDMQGYINRFNRSRDQVTNDESKLRLNGIFNNPDTREEALNLDLTKETLSVGDMLRFQDKQAKLRKDLAGDPRVQKAVGWMQQSMGAQLEALGVYRRTDANKDLYDKFRGSVQVGIDTFIEDNKRAPNYKEFMEQIAPRLLQTRDTSWTPLGRLFPTNTPFFDQANDSAFEKFGNKMRADFAGQQLGPPSDAEIYKAYVRATYSKLYGKKDKPR